MRVLHPSLATILVLGCLGGAGLVEGLGVSVAETPSVAPSGPIPQAFALPDPTMTPGAIDPTVTLERICTESTRRRRPPSTRLCDAVFAAYSIPPAHRYEYECDHDVPIALGGLTVSTNLWPQPNVEAAIKDRLEAEMQRRACAAYRTLAPAEAEEILRQEQRKIAEDWPAAARRYLGTGR